MTSQAKDQQSNDKGYCEQCPKQGPDTFAHVSFLKRIKADLYHRKNTGWIAPSRTSLKRCN
jgi:hypothetical protein